MLVPLLLVLLGSGGLFFLSVSAHILSPVFFGLGIKCSLTLSPSICFIFVLTFVNKDICSTGLGWYMYDVVFEVGKHWFYCFHLCTDIYIHREDCFSHLGEGVICINWCPCNHKNLSGLFINNSQTLSALCLPMARIDIGQCNHNILQPFCKCLR